MMETSWETSRLDSSQQAPAMAETSNVRVLGRFRPVNDRERAEMAGAESPINFHSEQTVEAGGKRFALDYIQPPEGQEEGAGEAAQIKMYESCAQPAVEDVLRGYNGTIFAYGQTGSGKTYTMFGPSKSKLDPLSGIIPRSTYRIFDALEEKTKAGEIEASVQASFLEIYCEEIRDLLNPGNTGLKLHETPSKGVWVEGLTQCYVSSAEEALNVIEVGDKCRSVAHTQMNAASSRSHSVFVLNITQVKKTGASGQTLEEAKKINQSLSALGNCINALTEGRPYVPYRDSKLTHLLRESLGGNTKSNLIVCCSPHVFNLDETVGTLRFAQRAKTIKTTVKQNIVRSRKELETMIERLKHEITVLKKGGTVAEMTDEQEHELMATNEQLAQARDTIDELRHKDEQSKALVGDVEAREQALKGKFDQYVKASADKLKFFQAQFDSACTMRDRYKSELERSQAELKTNLSKVGDESESIARAHEQVRELLEEKDEGLTAFKEMEAAALRLQEDIIKRCAERDNLLERMSELEATVAEMNTRNEELEKMLYEHITKDMTHKKFVKEVGAGRGPVSDVLSKLKRGSAGVGDASGKVREGWMLKKGAMNTEWKRRWFVLSAQERRLVYYKSDTAKKAQGYVALDNATVEELPSEAGTPSICVKTSSAFDQDKQAREYWIQGQSEGRGEIAQWMDALEEVALESLPFHVARAE